MTTRTRCIDCKHYKDTTRCYHPKAVCGFDPITGEPKLETCYEMRSDEGACSVGKLFEPATITDRLKRPGTVLGIVMVCLIAACVLVVLVILK